MEVRILPAPFKVHFIVLLFQGIGDSVPKNQKIPIMCVQKTHIMGIYVTCKELDMPILLYFYTFLYLLLHHFNSYDFHRSRIGVHEISLYLIVARLFPFCHYFIEGFLNYFNILICKFKDKRSSHPHSMPL